MKYYRYTNTDTENTIHIYRNDGVSGYEWYDIEDKMWKPSRMFGYNLSPDFFKELSEGEVFLELM